MMITAFQHVGMGVHDAGRTFDFYRDLLGFRIKLSDQTSYLEEMKPIVGALVEMRVIMAMNVLGGGAIELVEHTSTRPVKPPEPVQWGDLGYLELGLKAYHLEQLYLDLKSKGVEFLTPVRSFELSSGGVERYAYLRDPDGLLLQLVEVPGGKRPAVGGVRHVAIGVSDLDKARDFYGPVLGFTRLIHQFKGRMLELDAVTGGKEMEVVVLEHQGEGESALPLLERAIVKLIHTPGYKGKPIFKGRRWGDIGLMEMAFDISDLGDTLNGLISAGAELFHPPTRVDMGSGTIGSFSYIKNPDGGIVELVEVEKVMHASPKVMKYALVWLLKAAARLRLV
ncbi:MAG: VOC family protein [Actinomycetota bacterium]|nr:VOC family protein [Actinomycetota bacterium]